MSTRAGTTMKAGSRFYVHPESKAKVPGVTSVLNMTPKGFLSFWSAKVVAEWVADNISTVFPLVMSDRTAAIELMKGAPRRNTSAAGERGTEIHELYEKLARGQAIGRQHPELEVYVDHYRKFEAKYKPEYLYIEETVWSDTHSFAGSFDFIAKIDGETVIGDFKSTRSGVHAEVALQLAAYSHADYILGQDGSRVALPKCDAGIVFHIRPEAAKVVPVRIDDEVFSVFRHLLAIFDWEKEMKNAVLGREQPLD